MNSSPANGSLPRFAAVLLLVGLGAARAQCEPAVIPAPGMSGADGSVYALTAWDPDGPGPLGQHAVVAGAFTRLVDCAASRLGLYDPATDAWTPLGDCNGAVRAAAVRANGRLLIAGAFTSVAGVAANRVAEFDGTTWHALGAGIVSTGLGTGDVMSVVEMPNGDVVVGGNFDNLLGTPAGGIARFDGTNWLPMGSFTIGGVLVTGPMCLCVLANGDLAAGGLFDRVGPLVAPGLARWNGTAWSGFGTGLAKATGIPGAYSLTLDGSGSLLVGGFFDSVNGVPAKGVARWNGSAWNGFGSGLTGAVWSVLVEANGSVVATGSLTVGAGLSSLAARWNGTAWQFLGLGTGTMFDVFSLPNGGLLGAGGPANVARWNGTSWNAPASGAAGVGVRSVLALRNGGTFAGGSFTQLAGVPATNAALHNGNGWQATAVAAITASTELPDGTIVAVSSSATTGVLRRWNGAVWEMLGVATGPVLAVASTPQGDVIAAGSFTTIGGVAAVGLARWSGGVWSPVIPAFTGSVNDVALLPDGSLAAVGTIAMNGGTLGHFGIWNGTWSAIATASSPPTQVVVGPTGDVFVAGEFGSIGTATAQRVARWNGTSWQALGSGIGTSFVPPTAVRALAALPNGDLLVGGTFADAGGVVVRNLARWNGASWSAYGAGADASVHALDASADGRIVIGGDFVRVGAVRSALVARLQPTCPAVLTPYGYPCQQAGTTLALDALPAWIGGPLRSSATGLPAAAIVLALYGFQPLLQPLSAVLPIGVPGCVLSAQPDHVTLGVAQNGTSTHALPVPRVPALIGVQVFHQVLSLELATGGAFTSLASTPAVAATFGAMW